MVFRHPPIIFHHKRFECEAYGHIHQANRKSKLHDDAESGLFLKTEQGLHRVYMLPSRLIVLSKHVTVIEIVYLMAKVNQNIVYVGVEGTTDVNARDEKHPDVLESQSYLPTNQLTLSDQNQNGKQVQNPSPQKCRAESRNETGIRLDNTSGEKDSTKTVKRYLVPERKTTGTFF